MPRAVKIDTEWVKKKALVTIKQIENGELTTAQGQAIASLLNKVLNAITVESNTAEVKRALERLSAIERCLVDKADEERIKSLEAKIIKGGSDEERAVKAIAEAKEYLDIVAKSRLNKHCRVF